MDEGRILHVRAIGRVISKQELMIYFQSRKQSGGGDISSVELKEGEAVITFEESDVAKSVVSRAPHTLNGTQVEVSHHAFTEEFQSKDASINQTRVIIVRGLPQNITDDTVLNYFENTRRSGGGAVEEVKIEGSVARVEFESSEVAQHVVKHDKHILNGATLDVSLELLEDAESTSKTIKITGLAAKTTEDSISNYFENERRSGGGEVEVVDYRPEENIAFVTFKDDDAVKRVLEHGKHILDGATLDLTPINTATDSLDEVKIQESRVIEVTGLAAQTTEDAILNFFENDRRTGGGEIESVAYTPDRGIAFITFATVETAKRVLGHGKHTLDGATLTVTAGNTAVEPCKEEKCQQSRTIEVTGLAATTTKDAIWNFFENKRRSGGGEIEIVDFDSDQATAVITFTTAESALGVISKGSLTYDGANLTITLKQPLRKLPMDTRRLFVKGLSDKTTSDALQSYMEVVSGVDVLTAELGGEACAIVTFDEDYDYEAVTKKISRKPLEGKTPVVEQLPVCHCVQVSGFNKEKTTKDTVRYYFESPKNKGGDVSSVELNLKEGWALVYFEDPKVVLNVVTKSHFLSGAELDVRPHYSLLGKPQPVKADIELVQNIAVDGMKMQFILEHCKVDLTEVQNSYDVQMTWDESTHSVTVTPKDKASGDKHSFDEACEAIASFIADFVKSSTRVPPQAWNHVVDHFKKTKSPAQENLRVDCIPEQHAFLLIGKKQDVEDVTEELEGMIEDIDKRLKKEASKIERTVVIPYTRLQFLKHLEFAKELESQHEEVEVTILPEKGVVQIRGPPETIHKVTAAIWEAVAKMKDVKLNLPRNHLALLRSTPCQAFIRDMFTANNLQAIIASDEKEGNLFVLGTESDITEKALDLVKTLIVEECVDLDEDQVQLEKSEKWHLLREEMREKRIITLSFDESNKKICLLGVKEDVSDVVKAVNRFLEENTIISSVVTLPKGCRRFLVKYREQELRQIQEELKEYSTRIKSLVDEDEKDLVVSGTTCGVDKATELIQDLASKVQSQKMLVSKPGMRKVLDRGKGQKLLAMLENENECVIEYCKLSKAGAKEVKEVKKAEKKKESLCDLLTPDGKRILVFKDNICNRNVDVIVNAANSKLQHVGGVSKAIYERAGEAFRAECDRFVIDAGPLLDGQVAVTSAGKLPFQKVIHAVGPQWEKKAAQEKSMGKIPIQEKKLSYALKNALDVAKSYNSVAIPAIGTGVFEFPRELCAHIMVESVLAFFRENPSCLLSEVQFTSTDEGVVKAFAKEMDSRFLNDPNYQSSLDPKRKEKDTKEKGRATSIPDMSPAIVSSNTAPNVIKTPEGLELVLVIGDMSCEKVDVIVNSTSSDLNLSANASAMALSAAAGPRLQQECNTIGKVDTGEIVVTSGANLACKHVFHTSCAGWENGAGEKVLRDIIKKCLEEAQKRSLSTISIPAIGTGNLNFPRDCVAAASFDEAVVFSKKNPSTSLKAVHLVVYDKDLQSLQAFQTELQKRGGVGPPPPQPPAGTVDPKDGKKKRRGWRGGNTKRSDLDTPDDVGDTLEEEPMMLNPLQPEIMIGNVVVQAETGNITKEATDAIATLSNSELDVALGGGVGKAILAAGGPTIQTECSSMGSQKPGSVVVSGAGKLQVGKIYHMVPDYGTSMHSITDCILECLRKAESDGLTSISFPAVGTGNINKDAKEAAEGMMSAIFKFAREEPVSIALVRIVIYQPYMLTVFQTAMEASLSSEKGGTGFLSKLAGWFGFGRITSASSHSMSSMRIFQGKGKPFSYIEIFAGTKQDIDAVIKKIEKDVADHCTQKVIEREAICNLSKEQTQQIKKLEAEYDVTVNLEQSIGRISVRGDAEDVLDVATTIYDVLNQKIEEEHTRGVGELLSKNVQWFSYGSDDDETPEPYEPSINFQIEEAFGEGKDSLIVLIDEAKCKIAFKDMTETCLDDGEVRVVVRKEIGKGVPLPLEWDVHPKDGSGKEKEVHLVLLDPNASEYKKVAEEVRKTSPVTIIKMERVQNPVLYRQYMVRRDQMEHKRGGNEKQLFHGTAASSCPTISKFGFNRSYCGKNATVYGNGVYFARDASYSTQKTYSPPDATGNRHMYLARVLAGEYTTGRQGMITPPPKGSDATDAYDSVVDNPTNPTIFVVFYDNQCYPDYLITFR